MPDHAVLYNRSPISDRRVNNNYKLSHAGIRSCNIGMIEVRLHYDQIAGAIEILQVYCCISNISIVTAIFFQFQKEGKAHYIGQLTIHILYTNVPVTIPTKEN